MIKFFASYVGSKAHWVPRLRKYFNRPFVEAFAGSGVLSANLASRAVLNDKDPFVYKILKNFDQLVVPEFFSVDDYFFYRKQEDWWRYIYCLQQMSFSGVFRYSKNGYNVPCKMKEGGISIKNKYQKALQRWTQLSPSVFNLDYQDVLPYITQDSVFVLDPPYENAQAAYNNTMDYHIYWEFVKQVENVCDTVIVFDYEKNIPFPVFFNDLRKTRVNGKKRGNTESMFIFEKSLKKGAEGEKIFEEISNGTFRREDGITCDFTFLATGDKFELKSEYYSINRTKNFFIEHYSVLDKKTLGGPWQAKAKGIRLYGHFFLNADLDKYSLFAFDTNKLVDRLDKMIENKELVKEINIPNRGYTTTGFLVPRESLSDLYSLLEFDKVKNNQIYT